MYNIEKLREVFPDTTVYKDQEVMATFHAAAVPSFLRDWILKRKAGADGRINDKEELSRYIADIIPRRDQKTAILDSARHTGESKKFLAKVDIQLNIKKNHYSFELSDLGISHKDTLVEDYVWRRINNEILHKSGGWGLVKLGYCPPEDSFDGKGHITLLEYKNFCPYEISLDAYREARKQFSTEEWMDILLGAIDYNPDGYANWTAKHTLLTRLLPFIEPRVNLIELAPKGTGKSYLFGNIGKHGWLVNGKLTRAKLFYDMAAQKAGLVSYCDFVAMDELQSIEFDDKEVQGLLKNYAESGFVNFGNVKITGTAGILLLGNIPRDQMDISQNMFQTLPVIFQESALLDRFHGFIQGKNIPRMNEELKIKNWALNSEYFTEIMHLLRDQSECICYRSVVEEIVEYPQSIDTRDKEAVLRLCTAYLKLFFPHWTKPEYVNGGEFQMYCLRHAFQMRQIIRRQLGILDPNEYAGKTFEEIKIK
ncbi:MAG: BREX system Lon protease-like protein BrxL [Planctomycetaceae bacterium]|jgi:ATP-dependent Lon protease|nr:BREX system Lon protease-like protein BrxL [Planctomycetaceae bacterium]